MRETIQKYAHGLSSIYAHLSFKAKYCHKVFDIKEFREACEECFQKIASEKKIDLQSLGFDSDHIHMICDMGKYSEPELRKIFKGISGCKLLKQFPEIKQKFFWGSGLWNPAYDIRSINNLDFYSRYLDKQKYSSTNQKMLISFVR